MKKLAIVELNLQHLPKEHMHSFRNNSLKESTKLNSFIQTAKFNEDMIKNNVKWMIIHKIKQRKPGRICTLCNVER